MTDSTGSKTIDALIEEARKTAGSCMCDGSGAYPTEPDGEPAQCQWCDQIGFPLRAAIEAVVKERDGLTICLQTIMAQLADILDDDHFNNIEAIVLSAGVPYPPVSAAIDAGSKHE